MTEENLPYTTDELTDDQLQTMSLPDQIRYALYNGRSTVDEVADLTTYEEGWTGQMLQDLVLDGDVEEGDDGYVLVEDELPSGVELPSAEDDESEEAGGAEGDEPDETDGAEAEMEDDGTQASLDDTTGGGFTAEDGEDAPQAASTDGGAVASAAPGGYDDTLEPEEPVDPADVAEAEETHDGRLPVDRDYDWSDETLDPSNVEEYISANGEYEDIMREIETRDETGKLPHFRICGPTGCGKTSVGENITLELDEELDQPVPLFEVQCHDGLRPGNLLGMPTYVGNETWWTDGPLTKALLASQDGPTVLILDEVNRTTARTLGVVMSALDHQCRVSLNARGGEVIEGNPENLIVFSTMNQGDGYVVNQIDNAQVRRLGNTFYTDYVGRHDATREAELIADRTPVSQGVAREMVRAANEVREKVEDNSSTIKLGIPTSTMLDWARTAWAYRDDSSGQGPLVKAARRSVLNPYYAGNSEAKGTVETTIESHVAGMSVDHRGADRPLESIEGVGSGKAEALRDAGFDSVHDIQEADLSDLAEVDGVGSTLASRMKADVGDADGDDEDGEAVNVSDEAFLLCKECGWNERVEDADDDAVTLMECPECDGTLAPQES